MHKFLGPPPYTARCAVNTVRTLLARAGLDRRYRKVFAIGANKTATSSIHAIFEAAGMHATHRGEWRRRRNAVLIHRYQAFSDRWTHLDRAIALDKKYPRSRFILNTRDLSEWIDSRLQHLHFSMREHGFKGRRDWMATDEAVKNWVRLRNEFHIGVMSYFADRPGDLLIVNYIRDEHAAQKIRAFLDLDPGAEKPFVRPIPKMRDAGALTNTDMIDRCLDALGIPEPERTTDLYCPSLVTDPEQLRFPADTSHLR